MGNCWGATMALMHKWMAKIQERGLNITVIFYSCLIFGASIFTIAMIVNKNVAGIVLSMILLFIGIIEILRRKLRHSQAGNGPPSRMSSATKKAVSAEEGRGSPLAQSKRMNSNGECFFPGWENDYELLKNEYASTLAHMDRVRMRMKNAPFDPRNYDKTVKKIPKTPYAAGPQHSTPRRRSEPGNNVHVHHAHSPQLSPRCTPLQPKSDIGVHHHYEGDCKKEGAHVHYY